MAVLGEWEGRRGVCSVSRIEEGDCRRDESVGPARGETRGRENFLDQLLVVFRVE
jgi:hypothetical protein